VGCGIWTYVKRLGGKGLYRGYEGEFVDVSMGREAYPSVAVSNVCVCRSEGIIGIAARGYAWPVVVGVGWYL